MSVRKSAILICLPVLTLPFGNDKPSNFFVRIPGNHYTIYDLGNPDKWTC